VGYKRKFLGIGGWRGREGRSEKDIREGKELF